MTGPFLIGLVLLFVCAGVGLALVFYLAARQDRRKAKIAATIAECPTIWSSIFLDPKFDTRAFLQKSYRFGDIAVHMVPEGMLLNDGGILHWIARGKGSPLSKIASKTYSMDFIAMYKNFLWVQGSQGKFQLSGALSKGLDFKPIAAEWGWEIYNGVPEGAELPRRFKG